MAKSNGDPIQSTKIGKTGPVKGEVKGSRGGQFSHLPSTYEKSSKATERTPGTTNSFNRPKTWGHMPEKPE